MVAKCAYCGKKIGLFNSSKKVNGDTFCYSCHDKKEIEDLKKTEVEAEEAKRMKKVAERIKKAEEKRTEEMRRLYKQREEQEANFQKRKEVGKKEQDKLKETYGNDEVIEQFARQYSPFCLSLKCFNTEKTKQILLSELDLYFKYIEYGDGDNKKIYFLTNRQDHIRHLKQQKECFNPFKKLAKLMIKKYGDCTLHILVHQLVEKSEQIFTSQCYNICSRMLTKEDFFDYIINECEAFINNNEVYWFNEYMGLLLSVARNKKLINFTDLGILRLEIKKYEDEEDLKRFEQELLNSKTNTFSIKDVDSMNGFEFEGFVSKLFSNMGYKTINTKLSGDQGADVILERNNKKTVVQAKCYAGNVTNKAVQEVVASIKHYKADAGMVVTNSEFTKSAIELANSNDIRLIGRSKLLELINKYMNEDKIKPIENKMSSTGSLKKGIEMPCPNCNEIVTIPVSEMPVKGDKGLVDCNVCRAEVGIQLDDKDYDCPYCSESFNKLANLWMHFKTCKKKT